MRDPALQVPLSRKIVSWVVSIAMVLLLMPAFAVIAPQQAWAAGGTWTGDGSETSPYMISDAADLQKLATDVNGGNAYSGKYFKLGADIDLSGIDNWTPIGYNTNNTTSNAKAFKGTFDGDGHAIENMTITSAGDNTGWVTFALFGAAQGTFKNFTVDGGVTFTAAPGSSSQIYTAGVVGQATGAIAFENVGSEVNITVPDFYYTGGILARASGVDTTFIGCYNKGSITAGGGNVGGIVGVGGTTGSSFKACYNAGDIVFDLSYAMGRSRSVAGIAGSWLQKTKFESCFNYGKITYKYDTTQKYYGAMIGYTTVHYYETDGIANNYYLSNNVFREYDGTTEQQIDRAAGNDQTFEKTTAVDAATLKNATTLAALNNAEYETGKGYFKAGADYPVLYWEAAGDPTITTQPAGYDVQQNGTATALSVVAALPEAGTTGSDGTLSYQWYSYAHGADIATATAVEGATEASYTPPVTQVGATDYYCVVTNAFTVEGESMTATATSEVATVNVQDDVAASTPTLDLTLAETADQADTVKAQVAVSGLEHTDGKVSYKMEQSAPEKTFDAVEGEAEVASGGTATIEIPVDTYALGANSVKVTVTNTYQLTKTAFADETKTITISGKTVGTADELADFAAQVNAGDDFANRTVTLTANIDMSTLSAGKTFEPIGNASDKKFKGELAGGGKKIENLSIEDATYAALVGYADGASIHDLEVSGSVSGTDFAAGIVAYANNVTVSNVANHATITQTAGSNYSSGAGGIFGYSTTGTKVDKSYNDGAVTGKARVGGIVGYGNAIAVTDCYNLGTITNTGAVDSYNNGTAGIVGNTGSSAYGDPSVTITNAYNAGTIVPPSGATRSYGAIAYSQAADNGTKYPTCSNVFYLEGTSDVSISRNYSNGYDGTEAYASVVKPLSQAMLPAAYAMLGANWQQAPTNYHEGYPALSWETVPAASLVTFALAAPVDNLHLTLTVGDKTVTPVAQEDGTYTALLPDGTYSYKAEAFGYATQTAEFTVASEAQTITIPAFVASAKQDVTFTVTDASDQPIASPTIVVKNAEGTVMEGEFQTASGYSLPDGSYSYTVSAKGYIAKNGEITVAGAAVAETVKLDALPAEWDGALISEPVSEAGVYQIGHAAELAWLAQEVNAGNLATANAVLTADIDLSNKAWTAIGNADHPFVGTFDGQGNAVNNLNVVAASDTDYAGLFGNVGAASAESTIKGIVVSGKIDAGTSHRTAYMGGIAAAITNTTVEECGSHVEVVNLTDGMKGASGIVGAIVSGGTSAVKACAFDGTLSAYTGNYGSNIGGIVGKNNSADTVIDSCYNVGTVGNHYKVGGIIGDTAARLTVSNSYAAVLFGDAKRNSGQLAGAASSLTTYANCYYAAPEGSTVETATSVSDPQNVTKLNSVADLATVNLGERFVSKPWVNDGIPVLTWEKTLNAAKVTFTVTDAPEDTSITMRLGENDAIAAKKQADGSFAAYVMEDAQGEYTYTATAFGYNNITGTLTVGSEDISQDLGAFTEASKQTVTFVVNGPDGALDAGAYKVQVANKAGLAQEANVDGTFSLPPSKDYTYSVGARGFATAAGSFDIDEVTDAGTTITVTLEKLPAAWDGENSYEPEAVDGVYQIGTPYELAWLVTHTNETALGEPVSAVLTADIDLNNKPWTAIGTTTHPFVGTFDGQGHSVSGLSAKAASANDRIGLFGNVGSVTSQSIIKGVVVAGTLDANQTKAHVGAIAASVVKTKIEECGSSVEVFNCTDQMAGAGGIVGEVASGDVSSILKCHYSGTIGAYRSGYGGFMGGIVGKNNADGLVIDSCYFDGQVGELYGGTAGILGNSSAAATISNSYVTAKFADGDKNTSASYGGPTGVILGSGSSVTFTNCYYLVPDGSKQTKPANNDAEVAGITKVEALTDLTAEKLGAAFQDMPEYAPGAAILSWEELPKLALEEKMFTVDTAPVVYAGEPVVKSVQVASGYELAEGTDYTVAITDNDKTGTATIKITGEGIYEGELTYNFKIAEKKYNELTGTVYLTIADNGAWAKSADGATTMVHVPLDLAEVSKVDLDNEGLGQYKLEAAADKSYAYDISLLQAFVYAHKTYSSLDNYAVSGAYRGMNTNTFWGKDTRGGGDYGLGERDLIMLVNGNPAVDEIQTAAQGKTIQATPDAIALADGDFVDVGMFTNANSYSLFSADPNSTFWWFYDSDADDASITYTYKAKATVAKTLNLRRTLTQIGAQGIVPEVSANADIIVNYGKVLGTSEGTATTDEDGNVDITFPEEGTYYVWMDAHVISEDNPFFDYAEDETEIISTPAYAEVTVAPANTAPALAEGVEATAAVEVATNQAYELDLSTIFTDVDEDELTYKVSVNGAEAVNADVAYSYMPAEVGETTLAFTANDGKLNSTSTYTVTLTAKEPVTINVTVSISKYGELVVGKDDKPVAQLPVELTGKLTYSIDDALKAAHEAAYEGGAEAGYATAVTAWGLGLSKLWGDESGNFAYQINAGTVNVWGLADTVNDGDAIDAYIMQSWYPDSEPYAAFSEATASVEAGKDLELTLNSSTFDENYQMNMVPQAGAKVFVYGTDSENAPVTDEAGKATLKFAEPGTYLVTAAMTKEVAGNTVTAITAPVCTVTVTASKDELRAAVEEAKAAEYDGADAAAKEAVADELEAAQDVLDDPEATAEEIADAVADLNEAVQTAKESDKTNKEAAQEVIDMIEALPAADQATAADKAAADEAKAAYDALTDAQKAIVDKATDGKLDAVKAAADKAAADQAAAEEADQKAAQEVIDMINALPAADKATADDAKAAAAAKTAYDKLTDAQKAIVDKATDGKLDAVKKAADEAQAAADAAAAAAAKTPKAGATVQAGSGASAGTYKVATPAAKGKTGEVFYQRPKNYSSIKKVVVPATVKIAGSTYKVIGVEKRAFNKAKKLTTVSFGKNVKTIRQYAFKNAKKVTKITGGANIEVIEKNAFKGLAKLKSLPKLKKVKTIGAYAFKGCKKLKKVTVGTKLTTIGKSAFYNCAALKSFTVTKNVKSVGQYAFKSCKKLKKITVKSKKLTSKKSVSKCLKSSKVKTVKLKGLGSKKSKVKKAFKKYAGKKGLKF